MLPDRFRLVDLLLEPDLGLRLATDADPNVGITGAHPIEIENPTRWLRPGSMMLTTGSRFPGHEHPQQAYRELIRELVGSGIAALGYGVGVITDDVPGPCSTRPSAIGSPWWRSRRNCRSWRWSDVSMPRRRRRTRCCCAARCRCRTTCSRR
ncbi:PucR family transcriptional regulator ligand-binding domain-containing protein [Rhodococcus aetherivorans]